MEPKTHNEKSRNVDSWRNSACAAFRVSSHPNNSTPGPSRPHEGPRPRCGPEGRPSIGLLHGSPPPHHHKARRHETYLAKPLGSQVCMKVSPFRNRCFVDAWRAWLVVGQSAFQASGPTASRHVAPPSTEATRHDNGRDCPGALRWSFHIRMSGHC